MAIQTNLINAPPPPPSPLTEINLRPWVSSFFITAHTFKSIYEVLSTLRPGAKVILDVDNTLYYHYDDEFCMKYSFEYDPNNPCQYGLFFRWLKETYGEEEGENLFKRAFLLSRHKLTNEMWPALIKQLAAQNIPVMRLTAISGVDTCGETTPAERRIETEKSLGLDFLSLFTYPEDPPFSTKYTSNCEEVTVMTKAGEIFCARWPKHLVLAQYWDAVGYPTGDVVVVDDNWENIIHILHMCSEKAVSCIGIYYTELAEKFPGPFDEELAKYKFQVLYENKEWRSDSEARQTMRMRVPSPVDHQMPLLKQNQACHCTLL